MVSRLFLALQFMTASRVRKLPGPACFKCPSQEKEWLVATPFLPSATTTKASVSWYVTHGEPAGAKEAISPCPIPTCLPTIFQTTFGQFVSCINRSTHLTKCQNIG